MNEILDWTEQVKDVAKRLHHSQCVLKQIKKFLSLKTRIAYFVLVCLHILTCNNTWGGTTQRNHDNILRLQKPAERIVVMITLHL